MSGKSSRHSLATSRSGIQNSLPPLSKSACWKKLQQTPLHTLHTLSKSSSRPNHVYELPPLYNDYRCTNQGNYEYGNVMRDRRVVRGGAFEAREYINQKILKSSSENRKANRPKPYGLIREKTLGGIIRPKTPKDDVDIYERQAIEMRHFLEEAETPISTRDFGTQIDEVSDCLPAPKLFPRMGVDAQTDSSDTFVLEDFEQKINEIREVMSNKIIEQSLLEVMEAEAIAILKDQCASLDNQVDGLTSKMKGLGDARRIREEGQKSKEAYENKENEQTQMAAKFIGAMWFSKAYMLNLLDSAMTLLDEAGIPTSDKVLQKENMKQLEECQKLEGNRIQAEQCVIATELVDGMLDNIADS